ncbi:unnamed protein product [Litomosoides sigmodontis]|uniref:SURF1-like protein n=1 Tax=Litomosoides sigmodontis TaxID=42156 RepID=A0A3P6TAH1_LITSI|nr:unnamed protein product [Litomosoides sigmodontis]
MNVPGGLTNKLVQHLIADKSIKYLIRRSMQNSSIYDVTKLSNDPSKKGDRKPEQNRRSVAGLAAPLLAFSLGVWQLQRLQWKTNLLKKIEERVKQEVVPFPDDNLSLLNDLEYAKVKVTGEFLHDREFYVQPRQRFDEGKNTSKSRLSANNFGSTGAQVITPFKLHPSGNIILVNRGWVPPQKIAPKSRSEGQVQGQVTFDAVVRHSEKRPSFIRKNNPDMDLWLYTDIEQMAEKHCTLPVLVDACYESSIQGGPIGGQTRITHRNDHMVYACFWLSVGAATLFGWFF